MSSCNVMLLSNVFLLGKRRAAPHFCARVAYLAVGLLLPRACLCRACMRARPVGQRRSCRASCDGNVCCARVRCEGHQERRVPGVATPLVRYALQS